MALGRLEKLPVVGRLVSNRNALDVGVAGAEDPQAIWDRGRRDNYQSWLIDVAVEVENGWIDTTHTRRGRSFFDQGEALAVSGVVVALREAMRSNPELGQALLASTTAHVDWQVTNGMRQLLAEDSGSQVPWNERALLSDLTTGALGLSAGQGRRRRTELRLEKAAASADVERRSLTGPELQAQALRDYSMIVFRKYPGETSDVLRRYVGGESFWDLNSGDQRKIVMLVQTQGYLTDLWGQGGFYKVLTNKLIEEARGVSGVLGVIDAGRRGLMTFMFEEKQIYPEANRRNPLVAPNTELLRLMRVVGYAAWQQLVVSRVFTGFQDGSPAHRLAQSYEQVLATGRARAEKMEVGGANTGARGQMFRQLQSEVGAGMIRALRDVVTLASPGQGGVLPVFSADEVLYDRVARGKQPYVVGDRGHYRQVADALVTGMVALANGGGDPDQFEVLLNPLN